MSIYTLEQYAADLCKAKSEQFKKLAHIRYYKEAVASSSVGFCTVPSILLDERARFDDPFKAPDELFMPFVATNAARLVQSLAVRGDAPTVKSMILCMKVHVFLHWVDKEIENQMAVETK